MNLENVAIVGATGYSGEELIRILIRHPFVRLSAITSRSNARQPLEAVYPKFQGYKYAGLPFITSTPEAICESLATTVFLALPHGAAAEFAKPLLEAGLRVIDLSADFRIRDAAVYEEFYGTPHPAPELLAQSIYGMPEVHREAIRHARLIASPGCYPTSVILPLYPLLKQRLLDPASIVVTSLSGVSGAGRTADPDYLFAECNESVRSYGVPKHRHLAEIEQELSDAADETVTISFAPHLIPTTRGIHTTIHATPAHGVSGTEIGAALVGQYGEEPFVRLLPEKRLPDTKNVIGTNFIDIAWRHDPRTGRVILLSAEDNLVKGAAGQAIQSLNIMCGWPENTAL